MVAVVRQKIVPLPQELVRYLFHNRIDLKLSVQSKTLQDIATPSPTWGLESRRRPIYPSQIPNVVTTVCIFSLIDNHAGVKEATAKGPKYRGEMAGLLQALVSVLQVVSDTRVNRS